MGEQTPFTGGPGRDFKVLQRPAPAATRLVSRAGEPYRAGGVADERLQWAPALAGRHHGRADADISTWRFHRRRFQPAQRPLAGRPVIDVAGGPDAVRDGRGAAPAAR